MMKYLFDSRKGKSDGMFMGENIRCNDGMLFLIVTTAVGRMLKVQFTPKSEFSSYL